MKIALTFLLNAMDKIAQDFEEVTDTAVREEMAAAIYDGLIEPKAQHRDATCHS